MNSQYKENNFSTESISALHTEAKTETTRPNINHLIKRILVERRRVRKNTIYLGVASLLSILIFFFFLD